MEQSMQSKRPQRSFQEISQLLEEFKASGVRIQEFCERHGIPKGTFYTWKKRFRKEAAKAPSSGFVKVSVSKNLPGGSGPVLFAEVKGIRLYQEVSPSFLKALLDE
jgi:Transposase